MKKTARSMFVFTMVFALFLTCTAVHAIDDETAAVTTLYTSEEVSYYQALLTDFYTNNSRSNYSIYYDANDTRALNNTAFMNATNHLFVKNDWHSIITYIRGNDLLIYKINITPKEGIGALSPNARHYVDMLDFQVQVSGTINASNGINASVSYAAFVVADIHYEVDATAYITDVRNCDVVGLTTMRWTEQDYDFSSADWDIVNDSVVEITAEIDFGIQVYGEPDDYGNVIGILYNFYDEHEITVDIMDYI